MQASTMNVFLERVALLTDPLEGADLVTEVAPEELTWEQNVEVDNSNIDDLNPIAS